MAYLRALKSWWKGQDNLVHCTENGKNKEELKTTRNVWQSLACSPRGIAMTPSSV